MTAPAGHFNNMPLFSRILSRVSPRLLRTLRLRVFIDRERIRSALPASGTVVEVGCGYGHITSWLAEERPDLAFVGEDIDERAIASARRLWPRGNLRFVVSGQADAKAPADLVLLLHVLHHVPEALVAKVVTRAAACLAPGDAS